MTRADDRAEAKADEARERKAEDRAAAQAQTTAKAEVERLAPLDALLAQLDALPPGDARRGGVDLYAAIGLIGQALHAIRDRLAAGRA